MKRGVRDNLLAGQFQASLTNERFLARLKMYRNNTTSTEWKKSAQFWLKPTRRIPTSETEGKESWQKKERTFYVWSNFFDKIAKKSLSSDRAGSFGPVLREYWTGNAAIQLADFGGPLIKLSRVWYILIHTPITNLVCSPFVWQRAQVRFVHQLWQMQTQRWEIESRAWSFEDLCQWGLEISEGRHIAHNEEHKCDPVLWPRKIMLHSLFAV